MNFVNESKPYKYDYVRNCYGYDKPSKYLLQWSRLFQCVVSQAATYMLTGKFHDQECGIYKSEGGCNVPGVGELCLLDKGAYFAMFWHKELVQQEAEVQCNKLIGHIVLGWEPMQPIDSMFALAAEFVKVDVNKLNEAIPSAGNGVFGGDSLSSFFGYNPFSPPEVDKDYQRWCMVTVSGKSNEEVDQMYADRDLGQALLKRINTEATEKGSWLRALCCSPRRSGNELGFWINTGRFTQLDGWKTQAEIERFLASGQKLVDSERW